ncbi:hypothetical protein, partial [Niallia sp. 03091]|uniref:hypothetical protein n=1 Tax=Niallia sp. 03091 TaxID=3458059 RepID=UPI0040446DFE
TPRKAKQPVVESNLNNKKQAALFIVLNRVLSRFANEFEGAKFEIVRRKIAGKSEYTLLELV